MTAWPLVSLGEVLVERKERIGTIDGDGLPLLGVSNKAGLHRSAMPRIPNMSRYLRVEREWFAYNPMRVNVGSIGWAHSDALSGVISPDYVVFSCNPEINPRLLYRFLTSEPGLREVKLQTAGSVRERLYFTSLAKVAMPLPPIEEQRRIVERVEVFKRLIDSLAECKNRAMSESRMIWHSIIDRLFPESKDHKVGDYANVQSGYAFKSEWFSDEGVRLVRNVNIGHGVIDWSAVAKLPCKQAEEFERFTLVPGDILISLDRPIISTGVKVARVRECDLPCLLLQRVGRVCFKTDEVLPDYFYAWLQSGHFVRALDPGRSNGVPHISPKDVENISFSLPPLAQQRTVVATIQKLNSKLNALKKLENEVSPALEALMPSVLSQAFSGQL